MVIGAAMIATSSRIAVRASGAGRLRAVLAADRRELRTLSSRLRRLGPDDVHRARVLARRMRALLRVYAPAFERTAARQARRTLKVLARALDDCREADVREALFRDIAGDAASGALPPGLAARLVRARIDARRKATRRLFGDGLDRQVRQALARLEVDEAFSVGSMLERLDRRGRRLHRRIRRDGGAEALHRLRLAVKSLRYALTPLEDIAPAACLELLARLRDAQQQLGEQHDAALALAWVECAGCLRGARGRQLRCRLQERERASRRAAHTAARRVGPAWRRWRASAQDATEEPSVRRGRA